MMKPVRGSVKVSTRAPGREKARNSTKNTQKSKCTPTMQSKRVMGNPTKKQKNWKPLSQSSMLTLKNMFDMSVLSVLALKSKEKEESQKHLNIIKDQFLGKCAVLSVPPRQHGEMMHVANMFRAESHKHELGKQTLQTLRENVDAKVSTLEEMEVTIERLQERCRIMSCKLEEEEERAKELLELSEQSILNLPAFQPCSRSEPTLQERLMKAVPEPASVVKVLSSAPVVEDLKRFLELAHIQVDSL